jgi:hypothetical protein
LFGCPAVYIDEEPEEIDDNETDRNESLGREYSLRKVVIGDSDDYGECDDGHDAS